MKVVIWLVLLLTCIFANADTEGPSDYLQSKWLKGYLVLNNPSPRCFRSCSPDKDDLFWNSILGNTSHALTESRFLADLTKQFKDNKRMFKKTLQNNITLGVEYLDTDQNNVISADEFYREYLCMGFDLKIIKTLYDMHKTTENGIPKVDLINAFVQLLTEDNETDIIHDSLMNNTMKQMCPGCFYPDDNELYRDAILGKAVQSLPEPKFMELLMNEFRANRSAFIKSIHKNATLGAWHLDDDKNGIISAEEHYTKHLCLGYGLKITKAPFDIRIPSSVGIPTIGYSDTSIEFMTNEFDPNGMHDVLKNATFDYNDIICISILEDEKNVLCT